MSDVSDRLVTLQEFAAAFRATPEAARRWCLNGDVPGAFRTPGGLWRIPWTSIALVRERGAVPTDRESETAEEPAPPAGQAVA